MSRRITIADVQKREEVKPVRVNGIMNNGIDNAYPTRMERIRAASVTASAASNMMARFIVGDGFADTRLNDVVVGWDGYKKITAYKLLEQIAKSVSRQNGVFVRAGFNEFLETAAFRVEDYLNCRFSVVDDNDRSGKVVVYDNWDKSKSNRIDKNKFKKVNVWNPNKNIIAAQVDGDIKKIQGPNVCGNV